MRWLSLLANTRQKTLLKINKLVKDIERKDLSEGLGKLEPLRYRKGWIWRIDENGNILIASCRGHYEYEGADLVWHLSVHRKPRDSLVVFYIQKNEGYRNQVPNSPQNWSRWQDSNLRHLGPKPSTLPAELHLDLHDHYTMGI